MFGACPLKESRRQPNEPRLPRTRGRVPKLLALLALLASGAGRADCNCICVDGLNRPLCSQVSDVLPLCPPRVCPLAPAAGALQPPQLPPFDARSCSMEYLYNNYAARYEWRQLCR